MFKIHYNLDIINYKTTNFKKTSTFPRITKTIVLPHSIHFTLYRILLLFHLRLSQNFNMPVRCISVQIPKHL